MATDKASTGARTVESDPNFMLLFFYIRYTQEGVTDWDKLTHLMGLPTIGATKKRFSRLNQAQEKAMGGLDDTSGTSTATPAATPAATPIAGPTATLDNNTKRSKARKAEDASDDRTPAPNVKKGKVVKAKKGKAAVKDEVTDDGDMKEEA